MSTTTPPGWYPDPSGSGGQRYWDGTAWTEHSQAPAAAQPAATGFPTQQPAWPTTQQPTGSSTSTKAVVSLVSSLVWVCGLGSIVAVITGFMAKREIKESGGRVGGDGLATAGIVLGILGLIGGIAFTALGGAALVLGGRAVDAAQVAITLAEADSAQLSYHNETGNYTSDVAELEERGLSVPSGVEFRIAHANASGYCMEAHRRGQDDWEHVDQSAYNPGRCPPG